MLMQQIYDKNIDPIMYIVVILYNYIFTYIYIYTIIMYVYIYILYNYIHVLFHDSPKISSGALPSCRPHELGAADGERRHGADAVALGHQAT